VTYASFGIAGVEALSLDALSGAGEGEVEKHHVQPDYQ
jgi:hypothetical protein